MPKLPLMLLTAFYTLDYTADPDLWATRVCTLTTEAGCRAIQRLLCPAVEAMVQENQDADQLHCHSLSVWFPIKEISGSGK